MVIVPQFSSPQPVVAKPPKAGTYFVKHSGVASIVIHNVSVGISENVWWAENPDALQTDFQVSRDKARRYMM